MGICCGNPSVVETTEGVNLMTSKAVGSLGAMFMDTWSLNNTKNGQPVDVDTDSAFVTSVSDFIGHSDEKDNNVVASNLSDNISTIITQPAGVEISNNSNEKLLMGNKHTDEMASIGQLEIQKPAPKWTTQAVVNNEFKEVSLDDYAGKYLVLFFYPADFTFVCPTEIIAFSDRKEEFDKIDCEVVAASTDSHFSHFAWISTPRKQGGLGDMKIPILADKTGDIAKAYGIYKNDEGIAYRGLFIIDGKQNLRQITINDLPVGRNVDETLRLVQAFQFTDKYGEVCPAGWKPGQKTIKPTMNESKDYFEST